MLKYLAVSSAILLISGSASHATDTFDTLTEENISAFIQTTTEMSTNARSGSSETDLVMYFQEHIRDNANFRSNVTYNIPNYPAQQTDLSLTKDEYINSLMQGRDSIDDY